MADLRTRLAAFAAERLHEEDLVPAIQVDAEVGGYDFGPDELQRLYEQLAALEPFGSGNQPPALLWRNLRLAGRADIVRLSRQLRRNEDKLESVLQEVESLRDLVARDREREEARS